MLYLTNLRQYYLCCMCTDMCKVFNSHCGLGTSSLQMNVLAGLFYFHQQKAQSTISPDHYFKFIQRPFPCLFIFRN